MSDKKEQGPPGPSTFPDSFRESNANKVKVNKDLESSGLGEYSYDVSLSACDKILECDSNLTNIKDKLIKNSTEANFDNLTKQFIKEQNKTCKRKATNDIIKENLSKNIFQKNILIRIVSILTVINFQIIILVLKITVILH